MPKKYRKKLSPQTTAPLEVALTLATSAIKLLKIAANLAHAAETEEDREQQIKLLALAAEAFDRATQLTENEDAINLPSAFASARQSTTEEEQEMYRSTYYPQTVAGEAATMPQRAPLPSLPASPPAPTPATDELAATGETHLHRNDRWEDVENGDWYQAPDGQPAAEAPLATIAEEPSFPPTPDTDEFAATGETLQHREDPREDVDGDYGQQAADEPAAAEAPLPSIAEEPFLLAPAPAAHELAVVEEPLHDRGGQQENTDGEDDMVNYQFPGRHDDGDVVLLVQLTTTEPQGDNMDATTAVEAMITFATAELDATVPAPVPVPFEAAAQGAGWGLGARLLGAGWLWGNAAATAEPLAQAAPPEPEAAPQPVEPNPAADIFTAPQPVNEFMFPNGANPFAPQIFAIGEGSASVL